MDNICTGPASGSPEVNPTDCDASPWTAGFQLKSHGSVPRMVKAAGGRIWSPFFNDIDAAKVKEAHDLGLKIVVWTVYTPEQIAKMLELGVDGLITDRPDVARDVLRQRRVSLPGRAAKHRPATIGYRRKRGLREGAFSWPLLLGRTIVVSAVRAEPDQAPSKT
jgi:hypothetical protein